MRVYLTSNAPGATRLTVVDDGATATGYDLLDGTSFGSPVWEHTFSGARGTQGARAAAGKLPNREVALVIRVAGATKDALATKMNTLAGVVDDLRRFGGLCRWRSASQTRYQSADVLTAAMDLPRWDNRLETRLRALVQVRLTCGPYMLGDPMDVLDDFSIDNVNGGEANYTAHEGALADLAVSGGRLVGAGDLSTDRAIVFTGNGYTYGDHEATAKFAPGATVTDSAYGVMLKRIDASNVLKVYVDDNGANSRLRIDKVVAGVTTNLASTNLGARLVTDRVAWCRGRIEGNTVYAEHFIDTAVPTPTLAPTTSTSYILTTAEAAIFGAAIEGKAGILLSPISSGAYIDDFEVLPFTYRAPASATVLDLCGVIPGDAPAIGRARMAMPSGVTSAQFGLLAWQGRSGIPSLIGNGHFENANTGGWVVTAVAGVTGAASSIAAVVDGTLGYGARFGEYVGQVVTPATANTGASHAVYQRFLAGRTYTASIWVRASAGTTNVRLRFGVSGDIQSSTPVALSTTWTQHTVTWTPAASVDVAYLAIEVTAATATTFQIDGALCYLGATAPSIGVQPGGEGAARSLATFRFEDDMAGGGAAAANMTRTSDANANGGFSMADSSVAAGGETYTNSFMLMPGLDWPDDYTAEVAVEVWARVLLSAAFTGGVRGIISAGGEGLSTPTYSSEHGSTGVALVMPAAGNSKWRLCRLGTLTLPASRGDAAKVVLTVSFVVAAGTNLQAFAVDDITVVPVRSRFAMATGRLSSPSFLESATAYRTVESDLSSVVYLPPRVRKPIGGLAGSMIEISPGEVSVLGIASHLIPDYENGSSTSETQGFPPLHLAITPRYHWMRQS